MPRRRALAASRQKAHQPDARRSNDHIPRLIGSTSVRASARNSETGMASNEERNATKHPAATPRMMSGRVMRPNVYDALAPGIAELSRNETLSCCTEAPTIGMMNGVQMTM
jgi:hypothetical protein